MGRRANVVLDVTRLYGSISLVRNYHHLLRANTQPNTRSIVPDRVINLAKAKMSSFLKSPNTTSAIYRELTEIPTYTAAQFESSNVIHVASSTHDHTRNIKRKVVRTLTVNGSTVVSSLATDAPEIVAFVVSPSGKRVVVFREANDSSAPEGKKRFVEIWEKDVLKVSSEVTKVHGAVYTDELLSSMSFSPDESMFMYIAEVNGPENTDEEPFAKYMYAEELGEGYSPKKRPGIFLLQGSSTSGGLNQKPTVKQLRLKEGIASPKFFGQAVFASDTRIFAIGYEHTPEDRQLGIIYCMNRPSGLWELNIDSLTTEGETVQFGTTRLTDPSRSVRCPTVQSIDGEPTSLVWISNPVGGPHASCSSFHSLDLKSGKETLLVDCVEKPTADAFPGIYTTALPNRPFLRLDGIPYAAISSIWHSQNTVLLVSLEDGSVLDLTPDDSEHHYSWTVLGTDGKNQIICSRSSLTSLPELVLGVVDESKHVRWQVLSQATISDKLSQQISKLKLSIAQIPDRYPAETIILQQEDSSVNTPPCINMPHGGPHSTTLTAFNANALSFALEGYTVSLPNYTGSLGFGDFYVRKLLGRIGTLDVGDCLASVKHLVRTGIAKEGEGMQYVTGGSHGGFLTGHLIGQYPGYFTAAALRNPVISVGEISTSDIPDWYYEEAGIPFKPDSLVDPDVYKKLWSVSPISYVDGVKTPVLLLLGSKDYRVAPTQGKSYYHALKGRGKFVEMLCFKDDTHPIDSVEGSRVSFEATLALFRQFARS